MLEKVTHQIDTRVKSPEWVIVDTIIANHQIGEIIEKKYIEIRYYLGSLELREDLLKDKMVLDIGSNDHPFDFYAKEAFNSIVVSLDRNPQSIQGGHLLGVVANAENLPFKPESFDLIISCNAMPHLLTSFDRNIQKKIFGLKIKFQEPSEEEKQNELRRVASFFDEAFSLLKPGGQIRLSTFSESGEIEIMKTAETKIGFKRVLRNHVELGLAQLRRIRAIKKACTLFEQSHPEAQVTFKDILVDAPAGDAHCLIIIKKKKI